MKTTPKYPNLINLVLGDWSHDGHSQTEIITISSTLSKPEIEAAYKKGAKRVGVDVVKDVAADYEDGGLLVEDWKRFEKAGMKLEDLFANQVDLEYTQEELENADPIGFPIYHDEFVRLYCFLVSKGNDGFQYQIEEDANPNINIGGYGLFS
jgi:hypothetical protein